jgi:hypothetical protein
MALRRAILITTSLLAATIFTACGPGDDNEDSQPQADQPATAYGSTEEVNEYLGAMDPFIQRIGTIQATVDQVLGSSGKGTGENLAPAASDARELLNQLLEEFDAVNPPPLLSPFHRDIKKLITLRLEAYAATIDGWELEQDGGEFRGHYDQAQGNYKEANDVIVGLNGEMAKIHKVLQAAAGS